MKGSSKELQEVSIVALINDPYLLSKCITEIKESYFIDNSFKLIYRCLKNYYEKYMVLPTQNEMQMLIRDSFSEEFGSIDDVISTSDRIYQQGISSEDFSYEKVTDFIRRNKIEASLNKVVKYMEDDNIDLDQVATDLRDSIYLNFTRTPIMNLADVSSIREVREDALGSDSNPVIVKFFIDAVNSAMQYGGLIPGTLNMVTAPPGRGKTTLLINQGVSTSVQGYKILHIFLGDMSRYDGLIRYLSCFTKVDSKRLIGLSDEDLAKFIRKHNMAGYLSNIDIAAYAADQLTANQLVEEITNIQKDRKTHYNVIIIDYDENIAEEADNMYKSGGQIYNKMALFAVMNKSVVFIASQPKTEYWKQEIIPLEAASESSKKQKIIDLMITLGKPFKNSECGTLYIAKNRRGEDSKVIRLRIEGNNAVMTHIDEAEYGRMKQEYRENNSQ